MGYWSDHPEHEGWAVGLVIREGCSPDSGLYRELCYPGDNAPRKIERVGAGCDCGWRSSHWTPEGRTDWSPYSVFTSEQDEARVFGLWREHINSIPMNDDREKQWLTR